MTTNDTNNKCHSCQVEADVLAGTASQADRNHWSLWGCTCRKEDADDAMTWMDQVTR